MIQLQKNSLLNDLPSLCEVYRKELFDNFVPFWLKHSLDEEMGGYFTRLERDGHRYADDKDMWMVGREIWMFSHLYNRHEKQAAWLDAARLGVDFTLKHAFKPDGGVYFRLARDGSPLAEVLGVYTEVFVAIGLAAFSKAAGDEEIWQRATGLYERLMPRLELNGDTSSLGYPMKTVFRVHAKAMCRMTVAYAFHEARPGQRFLDDLRAATRAVVDMHWKPEQRVLLENVAADGSTMYHLQEGRMLNPGHALESAWMLMEASDLLGEPELFDTAVEIVLASLESGWDDRFGGLRYFVNTDRTPVHNIEADCKLWWVHGEALYATLLAWERTGREDLADWYAKIHDYTFSHFPDAEFGEWFGYLNRDGSPIWTAKANGWKGFFHIPRVLFRSYQLLDKNIKKHGKSNEVF